MISCFRSCRAPELAAGFLVALSTLPAPAQLDPEKALESMQPADDLEVSLFAAEPLLVNPTCFDVDPEGRVWVLEGVNYRGRANPPFRKTGDRIVVLTDKDGDGRADDSRVFHEGLDLEAPLGICHLGDRLFVSQSPWIASFEILPDGKAGARKTFLEGFGGRNHDHGVHSFVLGPDGLLYCAFGNEGANVTDPSGQKIRSDGKPYFGGMVFRCALDGRDTEVLAHNFRNNYECALDSFGNIWQSDNDDDGNQWVRFVYVMQGGNYGFLGPTGRHWSQEKKTHWHMEDPGVVPTLLRTGAGSPTGLCVYEGDLLPERWRGLPIHADAGPRVIQAFRVRPHGAGFHVEGAPLDEGGRQTIETLSKIVKTEVLLTSKDSFFRPSDVAVAPDGSLLVSDWYDPGVGGHGMGDTGRGRIYRLTPKGGPREYRAPPFDLSKDEGLAKEIASPCHSRRSLAVLETIRRGESAVPLLRGIAKSRDPILRARALWLLARAGGAEDIRAAFDDMDPRFRIIALRASKLLDPQGFVKSLNRVVDDEDPQVRREALVLLSGVSGNEALQAIVKLASRYDGRDRWYLEAVAIASRGRESEIFDALAERWGGKWSEKASALTWVLHPPRAAGLLLERLEDPALDDAQKKEVVATLARLEGRGPAEALARHLAREGSPAVQKEIASVIERRVGADWKFLRDGKDLEAAVKRLLATEGLEADGARLAGAAELGAVRSDLEKLAGRESKAPAAVRAEAVRALGAIDDAPSAPFLVILAGDPADPVAPEAIAALGRMTGSLPQAGLRKMVTEPAWPEARSHAVKALGSSKSGALVLIQMATAGDLPDAARSLATTVVHSSAYEDVRLLADKALPRPKAGEGKPLPPVSELAAMRGEARRGREAFFDENRGNCGRCHKVGRKGSDVGPDLSAIGTKLGREGLIEAILSPSAAIAHEYRVWILETVSAGVVTGYIVDESGDKITLKDANGKLLAFEKKDVTNRSPSDVSLMPEGLTGNMTTSNLVDIVEFLSEQKAQKPE